MILYRLVSWPYVKKHALRQLLTVSGIVIGEPGFSEDVLDLTHRDGPGF